MTDRMDAGQEASVAIVGELATWAGPGRVNLCEEWPADINEIAGFARFRYILSCARAVAVFRLADTTGWLCRSLLPAFRRAARSVVFASLRTTIWSLTNTRALLTLSGLATAMFAWRCVGAERLPDPLSLAALVGVWQNAFSGLAFIGCLLQDRCSKVMKRETEGVAD
ncbi:hypothetical protein Val02_66850 [Virgisporangium aliadipatigenens]|uniref:Uncharacterized protein n=1 Tax=Virgisporangium aliadipatigenens TaxID=741659 RepID=A0A8J3YQG0_9ACTN|nr:hypothetical protein Val02_66850 [Virgisporangium aliadipatigenens]